MRSCKQIFDKGLKPYYKRSVCLKFFFRFCFLKTRTYQQRYKAFALTLFFCEFFSTCKIFIPIIDFKIVFIPILKAKLKRISNAY
ncbi:hypothetical protein BB472_01945 [Helicobacter pylori]|uniref:hypothetical protein n=1 Tax=Helicobacter pylori TaxID=210 RepID=UPI0009933613|nr:hypothetical protein [Helicobacter pylori]OOQ21581.1 hypothetical protein B0X54_05705 [Helicobacter pylori]PDW51639.1 hypothetical protein BB435_02470 [Helicobacter pylori]PDW68223.1 hypothetical protein BB448_01200 [Helicobacter pylori]PDW79672.1 hypothetical protein BB383_01030 [Helicobacter pylori]PDX08168.1 hypothetical protein BB403_00970 [Helicobacter pylori]